MFSTDLFTFTLCQDQCMCMTSAYAGRCIPVHAKVASDRYILDLIFIDRIERACLDALPATSTFIVIELYESVFLFLDRFILTGFYTFWFFTKNAFLHVHLVPFYHDIDPWNRLGFCSH